jgi:hypothetical protein
VTRAAGGLPGRLLLSLLGEAQRDPEVRDALLRGLFNPRRRATARVVRQAQAAGMLRRDVSPLVAVDLLFGPLFYRRFLRQEPVTEGFVRQVFETSLGGLRPRPWRAPTARAGSAVSKRRTSRG